MDETAPAEKGERLSPLRLAIIGACPDWTAPYEAADRLRATGWKTTTPVLRRQMPYLARRGFLEFGLANNTYRATPAGREALTHGK